MWNIRCDILNVNILNVDILNMDIKGNRGN